MFQVTQTQLDQLSLSPLGQGCDAGWGPGALSSFSISSYFSSFWQPSPFPALSCSLAPSDKAFLLLLLSPPAAPSPQERPSRSKAVPRQDSHCSALALQKEG